jgi:ZIP family zinc transporter
MSELQRALITASLAGAMIPLGAAAASIEHIRPKWLEQEFRHSVIAFGGGALLAAIAFVLVPSGIARLPSLWAVAAFGAGGLAFFWMDRMMARHGGAHTQLVALVSDFIPEAMALGAIFAGGGNGALLLAVLIGVQNLPEGFNAFREEKAAGRNRPARIITTFVALAALGPLAALVGHVYLSDLPAILGAVMLFAAGGILYLTFQDVAVQAHLEHSWAPSLGAVAGFMVGLLGHMLAA